MVDIAMILASKESFEDGGFDRLLCEWLIFITFNQCVYLIMQMLTLGLN